MGLLLDVLCVVINSDILNYMDYNRNHSNWPSFVFNHTFLLIDSFKSQKLSLSLLIINTTMCQFILDQVFGIKSEFLQEDDSELQSTYIW